VSEEDETSERIRIIADATIKYFRILHASPIPFDLVQDLVREFHHVLITRGGEEGYTVTYSDYSEYLDAWRRRHGMPERKASE
jgi:hypothetical protein